jgi:hypothetical protein
MAGIGDLHALAQLILDSAAEALDTIPAYDAGLLGAPARKFISPGLPVIEANCCNQLTVYIPNISGDAMSAGKPELGMLNIIAFTIQISRCIPDGFDQMGNYSPPTPTAIQEAARQLDADAWALWNHLYNLRSSDLLNSLCEKVFFDGINATVPSGGCAGWVAQVRCELGGYLEALST